MINLFKKCLQLVKDLLKLEFIRFLLVGALNTAFSYGVYAFFILLHFHYSLATLFQIVLSTIFNYNSYGRLVFKKSDRYAIFRFIAACAVLYFLNTFGIKFIRSFGLNDYLAGGIMIIPVMLASFALNKLFVFTPHKNKQVKSGKRKSGLRKKKK